MENLGKAMQMAGFVLLFIIALSTAIYLYSNLITHINSTIVMSEYNNRAEHVAEADNYTIRTIGNEEVVMALVKINDSNDNIIVINSEGTRNEFKPNGYDSFLVKRGNTPSEGKNISEYKFLIIEHGFYKLSYEGENPVYTYISTEGEG